MRKFVFEALFTVAVAVLAYVFVVVEAPVTVNAIRYQIAIGALSFGIWLLGSMHITQWGFKKQPPLCVECGSDEMALVDNVLVCRDCENQQAVVAADRRIVPGFDAIANH